MTLRVTEIYPCILGESSQVGRPCTLVRLTGCNLRCSYCDSEFSFHGGDAMSVDSVVERVVADGLGFALITGGEPLLQAECPDLIQRLLDRSIDVQVETSGSRNIDDIPEGAHTVLDIKCPASGETGQMDWNNLTRLRDADDVKFVVSDQQDYEWARDVIREHALDTRCQVLISPAFGLVDPARIAEWLLSDRLPARLHLQVHKYVWEPDLRGV